MDATVLRPMALEIAAKANESELAGVFREFRLRIYHFALQKVGSAEDALDITQDTFLRLHRHWHRRDSGRPLAPWIYSIARNLSIDVLRKRGTRKEDELGDTPRPSHRPGPEALAERSEVQQAVWAAINQLPDTLRETLILRDIHGLRYAEIAETLDVPATTVTSRLHDARQKLRKSLEKHL